MTTTPIGMEEMRQVFEVVDRLEISRERIQVELLRSGAGTVERLGNGKIGIVLPADKDLDDWKSELEMQLTNIRLAADAAD